MSGLGLVVNICHTSISATIGWCKHQKHTTNHSLYSNTSCSVSQWRIQWERVNFNTPDLGNCFINFDEIPTSWRPPTMQNFISIWLSGWSWQIPSLPNCHCQVPFIDLHNT